MKIEKHSIHFIKKGHAVTKCEKLGISAKRINELASLNFPILESIVLDFDILKTEHKENIFELISPYIKTFSKDFNNDSNEWPLFLRIVPSFDLVIDKYPSIPNIGLTNKTIVFIEKMYGEDVARTSLLDLLQSILVIYKKISEVKKEKEEALSKILFMEEVLNNAKNYSIQSIMEEYSRYLPEDFFDSITVQLNISTQLLLELSQLEEEDIAIIVQPVLYSKAKKDFYLGSFFSRSIITGEKKIVGEVCENSFCKSCKDLSLLPPKHFAKLSQLGRDLEDRKKEITKIDFVIYENELYVLDARSSKKHTARAKLQCLLDMYNRSFISAKELINKISIEEANSLLYPAINITNMKKENISSGGIVGAVGVAKGHVYFF